MNLRSTMLTVLVPVLWVPSSLAETTVTYEYDELHRLTYVTYDDGSWIRYEYDAVGNRVLDVMNSTPGVGYLYAKVEPPGSGSVLRVPDDVWYDVDEVIELTAVPEGVCNFDHWSGEDVPTGHETDNPLTLTMSSYGYMRVVAHFDSSLGHMGEDCDSDGVPDGCEWSDTNDNGTLDDCDPQIARSPWTLENECDWGETAPSQVFSVWNGGLPDTLLDYTITVDDCEPVPCWLWVDPPDGTSEGDHDHIAHTVHYDGSSSLDVGPHTATITISDPDAGNGDQTVEVLLDVVGAAAVCRDTETLFAECAFGENAPDDFFDVWNCGLPGTTLAYNIEDDADWLSCDPTGGSSMGLPADVITVSFDTAALPAGLYFATITVTDPEAAYSPRVVQVVLTVTCPLDGWLPWDMNYDDFVSIIGDVPPFVDCVYFSDCICPGPGCLCPGDCNASGFLSIIGDVQCFVDCVYFDDCDGRGGSRDRGRGDAKQADGTFMIGGAVYTDLDDPLGSGLEGARIRLVPVEAGPPLIVPNTNAGQVPDSREFAAASAQPQWYAISGALGIWQIDDLRPGWYAITASAPGYVLEHTQAGVSTTQNKVRILVGPTTEASNQSIQFLAVE